MNTRSFLLAAGAALAMAFVFGCASDDDDSGKEASSSSSGEAAQSSSSEEVADYESATIGSQVWMKKNLNIDVAGSRCYDNDPANCEKYGRLYDWAMAMGFAKSCNSSICSSQISAKHRGICPAGWHLPSNDEWIALIDYAGGQETAGTLLKATSGWNSYEGVPAGTDFYGFAALPGGWAVVESSDGSFYSAGYDGYWWSATEDSDFGFLAYYQDIVHFGEFSNLENFHKAFYYSVRCVKD